MTGLPRGFTRLLVVAMSALLLTSCGGDGGSGDDTQPVPDTNAPPVADAGGDRNVTFGSVVELDGSGSSDADDDPLSYQWTLESVPVGSTAALSDTTAESPTFTADMTGEYVVRLVVNDGTEDSAPSLATLDAWVRFEKVIDVAGGDWGNDVEETADGGYIIAGETVNYDSWYGAAYLVKTDGLGNEIWSRTYQYMDLWSTRGESVLETSDGGFVVAGETSGYIYLLKTDADGNEIWSKTLDAYCSGGHDVQETSDGGFIIVGENSFYDDVCLVKTDADGNELWWKLYGPIYGYSVQETSDGGFIVAGASADWRYRTDSDVYLLRTDSDGNELWSKTIGGSGWDEGYSVQETSDGGFVVVGGTTSFGVVDGDVYLVRTDADGNELWSKTFGDTCAEGGVSAQVTSDGGIIIAGGITCYGLSAGDFYLVRTDADGNEQWSKAIGGMYPDWANAVQETADGGFVITGQTNPCCVDDRDVYLVKTDANGDVD